MSAMKRENENPTQYWIRRLREETIEECAKEAEVWQGLKGPKLADKIRALAGKEGA